MAAAIPYMAAGYVADRALGGNGMTGLTIGSLGAGAAGGFTMPSFSGSLGTGATAANSLGGGTALMGGASTAVGTGASSGAATGILGSSTNAIPSYDIGMEGLKSNIGGFTAPVEQSLVNANAYQPLNSGIAPDMSFKQSYINTTPEQGMGNLGVPQTPDNVF